MREKIIFESDWLTERYAFDVAARNKMLEQRCLDFFTKKEKLFLLDVGSGTGNNTQYLMQQFPQNQEWILVEQDASLCEKSIAQLQQFAQQNNWQVQQINPQKIQLYIPTSKKEIRIQTLNASLLDIEKLLPLNEIDLITNSAVFDLFTPQQFKQWIQAILKSNTAFYASLNYTGMQFFPSDAYHTEMIQLYEQHMQREQQWGKGMGADCANIMEKTLTEQGATTHSQTSIWQIPQNAETMLYFILHFMDEALHEMPLTKSQTKMLKYWLQEKRTQVSKQELGLEVYHQDIFAYPS